MDILIVDDESSIREMLRLFLELKGYTVASAINGQDALDYLRQSPEPPQMILLDLMMPVMSGAEFRAAQLRISALASIPFALVSADANLRDSAPILNVEAYLPK
ncbi:MAG TPA: response regulator, partial [Roseiflexaceae bacterium]|nr:response regulator [Roseiflexaceae bacterium]